MALWDVTSCNLGDFIVSEGKNRNLREKMNKFHMPSSNGSLVIS
jgi:hypothetical protein